MNNYDLKLLIDKYRKRVEFAIESNNLRTSERTYDSQLKKYIKNRSNQIGTFLEDGKILFYLEGEEDLNISNPKLGTGCFQYYNLETPQLMAYIGFRSKIRKNILPKNPQMSFLSIYLMEVLNDFYSSSFDSKLNLVKKIDRLFTKGVKYKKLITEAFEHLFFQCPLNLSIAEFKKKYDVYNIFENYSEDSSVFDKYEYIYTKSRRGLELNRIDDYLIRNSFKRIINILMKIDFNLKINGVTLSIEEALNSQVKHKTSINKLYCLYPINVEKKLFEKTGRTLIVSNGTLKNYGPPVYSIEFFNKIIEYSKKSFRKLLDGPIVKEEDKSFVNSYFLRNKFMNFDKEKEIFEIIKTWVDENPYCKNAYKLSYSQLEFAKKQSEFNIDLNEVTKIRESSAKIQDKLIIEDDEVEKTENLKTTKLGNQAISYFESIRINKNLTNKISEKTDKSGELSIKSTKNSTVSGKLKENNNNIYTSVVKSLTKTELLVLNSILSGNLDKANKIAQKENVMLSLIIDAINLKATELTEDIIIEEEMIVEDYKQQLTEALS